MKYKHIFGPVPSRRLGISLGVDIVPFKTCTLNCIYCECGSTPHPVRVRREYISTDAILREIGHYLSRGPHLDYVTITGSGEPTLHSRLDLIVRYIKTEFPDYRVALLTNGTLFHMNSVRKAVSQCDLIVPSLDAVHARVFREINRPASGITAKRLIEGLVQLRGEYEGQMWLEVVIVPGVNDTVLELSALRKAIDRIGPDKVHLNTLDRPGAEDWVMAASKERLKQVAKILGAERVRAFPSKARKKNVYFKNVEHDILALLKRRPCTAKDIAHLIGIAQVQARKHLSVLMHTGSVTTSVQARGIFYVKKK